MRRPDQTLDDIKRRYDAVLAGFRDRLPEVAAARTKSPGKLSTVVWMNLVRIFLWWSKQRVLVPLPRYVFQDLRHPEIALSFDSDQVAIIGGRREYLFCRKHGLRFVWGGFITRAFDLFYWSGMAKPLIESIEYLNRLFSSGERFLFLWEDSMPTGIVLAHFALEPTNVRTICVAHGYYGQSGFAFEPEGRCCQANFVWSESQHEVFSKYGIDTCFTLGVPFDISVPCETVDEVVLVGHCGRESSNFEYFYTLSQFVRISKILEDANIEVSFRPHPRDDFEFVEGIFSKVSYLPKGSLLANARRIYIGYVSSLLFECKIAGNLIIGIDSSILGYKRDFEVDVEVGASNYDDLPAMIISLQQKLAQSSTIRPRPLIQRLGDCIEQFASKEVLTIQPTA